MSDLPPLNDRIVRVVVRFGGTAGDAARAIGCSKHTAARIARGLGLTFRGRTDRHFECAVLSALAAGDQSPRMRFGFRSPRLEAAA